MPKAKHPHNIYTRFIENYTQGNILKALQAIIAYPDIAYDSLDQQEPLFRFLVNFADACVFKGYNDAKITASVLKAQLSLEQQQNAMLTTLLETLKYEVDVISNYEALCVHALMAKEELPEPFKNPFAFMLPFYLPAMQQRQIVLDRFRMLLKNKPSWGASMGGESAMEQQPWHVFSYPNMSLHLTVTNSEEVPVVFLQPIENLDYASLLRPYLDRPIIYVFETLSMLFQHLQYEELFAAFNAPQSVIYILEHYPNSQLAAQDLCKLRSKVLKPYICGERTAWQQVAALFTDVLKQVINLEIDDLQSDGPLSNWLYSISKRLLYYTDVEKLGSSRTLALVVQNEYQWWVDPHKGQPPHFVDLGPEPKDNYEMLLRQYSILRQVSSHRHDKIRLVHVVPQIVDVGHAPTKLLKNLIEHHDRDRFTVTVLSTERMVLRPLEYPVASQSAQSSKELGAQTIQDFNSMDVQTFLDATVFTYLMTAYSLTATLKQLEPDIVVFHGPDVINNICSVITDVPKRVLFEHGTPPTYDCYDLVILSTEAACNAYKQSSSTQGVKSCYLPFAADTRAGWEELPYSKESLGLPNDSFVMTTISNHLEERVGVEMRKIIAEILRRSPKAYYAPIGQVKDEGLFRSIFEQYGVADRVVILGGKANASQYARSMDLYLNEFPKGSCLGMLDAMAAGCPVVSMHDQFGLPNINYAEVFFGNERVVHSGKSEDYIDLACRLIADPALHREWAEHARQQYEKHHNVVGYVKQFEAHILSL